MKTITFIDNNRSIILTNDSTDLKVEKDHVKNGNQKIYGLGDTKVVLHENIADVPDDWQPSKYLFNGSTWTANPNWQDPEKI